ncbi:MAG: hypothetical protein D6690_16050 [Nitrospirae bacterium]|nr:MAG: hypothetical protein D6690_16050 [Nitrospirota bacterium]
MNRLHRYGGMVLVAMLLTVLDGGVQDIRAVVVHPTRQQVGEAVGRGLAAAKNKISPNQLYQRFGSSQELEPSGMLLTKLSTITVMTAHFALRSAKPSTQELQQMLSQPTLQISITLFGDSPRFAQNSYVLLTQGNRVIKPVRVRSDAWAHKTRVWPQSPAYRATVVASFAYDSFDPLALTIISVFPGSGGEMRFEVDFSQFP